jgi:hypothetical protein
VTLKTQEDQSLVSLAYRLTATYQLRGFVVAGIEYASCSVEVCIECRKVVFAAVEHSEVVAIGSEIHLQRPSLIDALTTIGDSPAYQVVSFVMVL